MVSRMHVVLDAMTELLRTISTLAIVGFAVSSMLAAGCSVTLRAIVAPMREPDRVIRALLGNFVLVPLIAAILGRAFDLEPAVALGFILLGTAAGAPFLIKLVAIAEADLALGTGLLVLLVPMTVVYMPIAVPLFAPDAAVDAIKVALTLATTLLVPLALGLLLSELAPRWAKRLLPIARTASTVTLAALLATTLIVNRVDLIDMLASRALVAIVAFVLASFAVGFLIASPHPERRIVLGLGTAQRNIAASTVVAAEEYRGPDTLVLVVVASTLTLFVLIPTARWIASWRMRAQMLV